MKCEPCAIDSIDANCVDQRLRQDSSNLRWHNPDEVLSLHPAVRECVVMDAPDAANIRRLAAFKPHSLNLRLLIEIDSPRL